MTLKEQLTRDTVLYGFCAVWRFEDGREERADPKLLRYGESGEWYLTEPPPIGATTLKVQPSVWVKTIETEIGFAKEGT